MLPYMSFYLLYAKLWVQLPLYGREIIILLDAEVGIECDDDGAQDIMY